jgi:hypothetical protein
MVVYRKIEIITSYEGVSPPGLSCSYTAITGDYDGPGSPMGVGLTEADAVADLYKCICEREDAEAYNTLRALIKRADAHFEE